MFESEKLKLIFQILLTILFSGFYGLETSGQNTGNQSSSETLPAQGYPRLIESDVWTPSWQTRTLEIQAFKSPYAKELNLNSFLDDHEISKYNYPQNESDGEKLLNYLKDKWRELFYTQDKFVLSFPPQPGQLGLELNRKARALLSTKSKIIKGWDVNSPTKSYRNWSLNHGTIFRLYDLIRLDDTGPILLIQRVTNKSVTDGSSMTATILDHVGYTFSLYDDPLEVMLVAGVNKTEASIDEITKWEADLILNKSNSFFQYESKESHDIPAANKNGTITNIEPMSILSQVNNSFHGHVTPIFLKVDQLTHIHHDLIDLTHANNEKELNLYDHPGQDQGQGQTNWELMEIIEKIKIMENRIKILERGLTLIATNSKVNHAATILNQGVSLRSTNLTQINEMKVKLVKLESKLKAASDPKNTSEWPEHAHAALREAKKIVENLEQNLKSLDTRILQLREELLETQREATAVILGDGGKSEFEIQIEIKQLKQILQELNEKKDYIFYLDSNLIQNKKRNLEGQMKILTNWQNFHEQQRQFVHAHFPQHLVELDNINSGNSNLTKIYEIHLSQIETELSLVECKIKHVRHFQENGTFSKFLNNNVTQLTRKFEEAQITFKNSRDQWHHLNQMREEFIKSIARIKSDCGIMTHYCEPHQYSSSIPASRVKIERGIRKLELRNQFIQNSWREVKGQQSAVTMEQILKMSTVNCTDHVPFMQLMEQIQFGLQKNISVSIGPKTMQKLLTCAKNSRKGQLNTTQLDLDIDPTLYPFLTRDFNKAIISNDPTYMSILEKLTGVTGRVIDELTNAKWIQLANDVTLGSDSTSFDLYSLLQSGQCLNFNDPADTNKGVCQVRHAISKLVLTSGLKRSSLRSKEMFGPFVHPISSTSAHVNYEPTNLGHIYPENIYNWPAWPWPMSNQNEVKDFKSKFYPDPSEVTSEMLNLDRTLPKSELTFVTSIESESPINISSLFYWAYFIPSKVSAQSTANNKISLHLKDWKLRHFDDNAPTLGLSAFTGVTEVTEVSSTSRLEQLNNFNLFCRPLLPSKISQSKLTSESSEAHSYLCENAIGIRLETGQSVKGQYAHFNLESGFDSIDGFEKLPNLFRVNEGQKHYNGGSGRDIFFVENGFTGILNGTDLHENILILSDELKARSVQLWDRSRSTTGGQILNIDGHESTVIGMTRIQGRKNQRDIIQASCHTKFIDGQGGGQEEDEIRVNLDSDCGSGPLGQLHINVPPGTKVENEGQGHGHFLYNVQQQGPTQVSGGSTKLNSSTIRRIKIWGGSTSQQKSVHAIRLDYNLTNLNFTINSNNTKTPRMLIQGHDLHFEVLFEQRLGSTGDQKEQKSGSPQLLYTISTADVEQFLSLSKQNDAIYIKLNTLAKDNNLVLLTSSSLGVTQGQTLEIWNTIGGATIRMDVDSSDLNSMARILTGDGAQITLQYLNSKYEAIFYFPLKNNSGTRRQVWGSLGTSNYITMGDGNYDLISGGKEVDHFKIGSSPHGSIFLLSSNENDTLEIDMEGSSNETTIIDLPGQILQWGQKGEKLTRLDGSFKTILGGHETVEHLAVDCSTKYIDLRGVKRGQSIDLIKIPKSLSNCPDFNVQVQIWPGTQIQNNYGKGQILYNVPSWSSATINNLSHDILTEKKKNLNRVIILDPFDPQAQMNNSAQHFIYLNYAVQQLDLEVVQMEPKNEESQLDTLAIKSHESDSVGSLNLEIHLNLKSLHKSTHIITMDGAKVSISNQTHRPIFTFKLDSQLNSTMKNFNNILGSLILPNHFDLISGNYNHISGGAMNDQFKIGRGIKIHRLESGPSRVNLLSLDPDDDSEETVTIDIMTQRIHIKNRTLVEHLEGNFSIIYGRQNASEHLIPNCSTQFVNLLGGVEGSLDTMDRIDISSSCLEYNLTTDIWAGTMVTVEGGGRFNFNFQKLRPSTSTTSHDPNPTSHIKLKSIAQTTIYLNYTARELQVKISGRNEWQISPQGGGWGHQLNLFVDSHKSHDILKNLEMVTSDGGQIIVSSLQDRNDPIDPYVFFPLSTSSANTKGQGPTGVIVGAVKNKNVYFINGTYTGIIGGHMGDRFIIGAISNIKYLNDGGGTSDDTLEIHNSTEGSILLNLPQKRIMLKHEDEVTRSIKLLGNNFKNILGRANTGDDVITTCDTRTVNLMGAIESDDPDLILVPHDLKDHCTYDLLVENSDQTILFNGGVNGMVHNKVNHVSGNFTLFTLYNGKPDLTQRSNLSMVSNYNLNVSFFDLKSIQVDLHSTESLVSVTMSHGTHDQDLDLMARFLTHQLDSYTEMMELFKNNTKLKEVNKVRVNHTQIRPTPRRPIQFPTFYTKDDYQININHLGGVHILHNIKSNDHVNEIIKRHVDLVYELGVTLIISRSHSPPNDTEIQVSEMIYIGGDDERNVLINHPNITSHLVSIGGSTEAAIFKLFPTHDVIPIYLHTFQPILNGTTLKNDRVNAMVNLNSFFEFTAIIEIPKIMEDKNNLRIFLPYSLENGQEGEIQILYQEIILVNGIHNYNFIHVTLDTLVLEIKKTFKNNNNDGWHWELAPQSLNLNPPPHFQNTFESFMTQTRYVILSSADLVDYAKFKIPLHLNRHVSQFYGVNSTLYTYDSNLILTNNLNPSPPFQFKLEQNQGTGVSGDQNPQNYEPFSIIMLDLKEALETFNFKIILSLDTDKTAAHGVAAKEVTHATFDDFKDYQVALGERSSKMLQNEVILGLLLTLIVILCLLIVGGLLFLLHSRFLRTLYPDWWPQLDPPEHPQGTSEGSVKVGKLKWAKRNFSTQKSMQCDDANAEKSDKN